MSEFARYQRVAGLLRDLRDRAHLTQEETAHRVNLTLSGYRAYEQGRRNLTVDQMERFAEAFDVPISEITSRLWPDDHEITVTHYAADFAELERQVAHLPRAKAERILRSFRASLEIALAPDDDDLAQ